jgi:hypothetical protein
MIDLNKLIHQQILDRERAVINNLSPELRKPFVMEETPVNIDDLKYDLLEAYKKAYDTLLSTREIEYEIHECIKEHQFETASMLRDKKIKLLSELEVYQELIKTTEQRISDYKK